MKACRALTVGAMALTSVIAVVMYSPFFDPSRFWVGFDFLMYYVAAFVSQHGGNPYAPAAMAHAYERVLHLYPMQAQQITGGRPCLQTPLTTGLFQLALLFPPLTSLRLWWAVSVGLLGTAVLLAQRLCPVRARYTRAILFALSPPAMWGIFLGQIDALVLLVWVIALWCFHRRRYSSTGMILMLGLLKPQLILGPVLLLAFITWRRSALPAFVRGAVPGALAVFILTYLLAGPRQMVGWLHLLTSFSAHGLSSYDDLASLATLYVGWPHVSHPLEIAGVVAWVVVMLWQARRLRAAQDELWWLFFGTAAWLLVTPYAHSHDAIFLLPALLWYLQYLPLSRSAYLIEVALWGAWWVCPYLTVMGYAQAVPVLHGLGLSPILLIVALLWCNRPKRLRALKIANPQFSADTNAA